MHDGHHFVVVMILCLQPIVTSSSQNIIAAEKAKGHMVNKLLLLVMIKSLYGFSAKKTSIIVPGGSSRNVQVN
jgi:hypothetical protein